MLTGTNDGDSSSRKPLAAALFTCRIVLADRRLADCLLMAQSARSGTTVRTSAKSEEVFWGVDRIAMISKMRTARPTTGPPFSVFEARTAPFDPVISCFCFFSRLDPADPFVARKRRNVLPGLQRLCVGDQCLFQVRGQVMDHTA